MPVDYEKLEEKRILRNQRGRYPLKTFYEKLKRAELLLRYVETPRGRSKTMLAIRSEARRLYIVSLVTAFEVYLSDIIKELIDNHKIKNLLRADSKETKYTLAELHDIIEKEITVGDLISASVNFQNLDVVNKLLAGVCTSQDFFEELTSKKFKYLTIGKKVATIIPGKNFKKQLYKMFNLRHQYIHDISFNKTPRVAELMSYKDTIRKCVFCLDIIVDKYRGIDTSEVIKRRM